MIDEELMEFQFASFALDIIENYTHALEFCRVNKKPFNFYSQYVQQSYTYYHSLMIDIGVEQKQLISVYSDPSVRISGYHRNCGGIGNTDKYHFVFDTTGNIPHHCIEVNDKFKPFTLTEEEHFQYSLIYDLKSFEYYKRWSELFSKHNVPDDYIAYWYYHPEYSLEKLEDVSVNMRDYRESLC